MKDAHIIILSGQSNACGVARYKLLKDKIPTSRNKALYDGFNNVLIRYWSHEQINNNFEPVRIYEGFQSCDIPETFGPELGLAETLSKQIADTVYIAKWSYGGASLDFDYCTPETNQTYDSCAIHGKTIGWCYIELVKFLKCVIDDLLSKGLNPVFDCFLWMQGESDACDVCINRYEEKFISLINCIKKEFKNYISPSFSIIDAAICEESMWPLAKELNAIKEGFAKKMPNYYFVNTNLEGLKTNIEPYDNPDIAHYDSTSMLKLGNLYGEEYLKHYKF